MSLPASSSTWEKEVMSFGWQCHPKLITSFSFFGGKGRRCEPLQKELGIDP